MNLNSIIKNIAALITLTFFVAGCESWQVKSREQTSPSSGSGNQAAQPPPQTAKSNQSGLGQTATTPPVRVDTEPVSPEQVVVLPPQTEIQNKVQTLPKVGVIIGPGHLRSFIAIGILQELQKSKIPIAAMIGMEWGSIPAGLFAIHGQANEVEWQMMKLKEKDIPKKGILSQKLESESVKNISAFLGDAFSAVTFEQLKIPFTCLSLDLSKHQYFWMRRGELANSLANCISHPPYFHSENNLIAGVDLKLASEYLRQMGASFIVFINLLPSGGDFFEKNQLNYASEILWSHYQQNLSRSAAGTVDFVIDTSNVSIKSLDFENRRDMVRKGQDLGHNAAKKISQKLGL
jgi:NTE family protein